MIFVYIAIIMVYLCSAIIGFVAGNVFAGIGWGSALLSYALCAFVIVSCRTRMKGLQTRLEEIGAESSIRMSISDQLIDAKARNKAYEMLHNEYGDLIEEIDMIRNRISNHKERFKYDWESKDTENGGETIEKCVEDEVNEE